MTTALNALTDASEIYDHLNRLVATLHQFVLATGVVAVAGLWVAQVGD